MDTTVRLPRGRLAERLRGASRETRHSYASIVARAIAAGLSKPEPRPSVRRETGDSPPRVVRVRWPDAWTDEIDRAARGSSRGAVIRRWLSEYLDRERPER